MVSKRRGDSDSTMLLKIFGLVSCLKILLINCYKSTDFEVHRNWLALTYSLPVRKWYYENTSEWTLDYPPFFAWFEYLMTPIAYLFDPEMLKLKNQYYSSADTILFMRLSVVFSDMVLAYGCKQVSDYIKMGPIKKSSKWKSQWGSPSTIFYVLVLANIGLLFVDHMHFQYNGFLFGILLVSIGKVLKGNYIWGAFFFSVLLNMKHIFLYMAPAYGVYLFRSYCVTKHENGRIVILPTLTKLVAIGSVPILVTFISFGPFIAFGQLGQVLSRLFPFDRGLTHAYWAPNFWALYNTVDKMLSATNIFQCASINNKIMVHKIFPCMYTMVDKLLSNTVGFLKPGLKVVHGSMTGGMVQRYDHAVLPSITPPVTAFLVIISMLPCLWKLWKSPGNPLHFVRAVIICTSCAFLFGWHVHEKAILMVIIPQSLMAVLWRREAEVYTLLATTGHFSLLPLINTEHEHLLKILYFIAFSVYISMTFWDLYKIRSVGPFPLLSVWENMYIYGLIVLYAYENVIHKFLGYDKKFPFLPLMLTSCYCSLGVLYSTLKYYYYFLQMDDSEHKQKTF